MWNSKPTSAQDVWSAKCSEVCWEEGMGIGVSESEYNQVLALEVLNVIDCVERKRRAGLPASVLAPRAVAAAPSFQACLCACI